MITRKITGTVLQYPQSSSSKNCHYITIAEDGKDVHPILKSAIIDCPEIEYKFGKKEVKQIHKAKYEPSDTCVYLENVEDFNGIAVGDKITVDVSISAVRKPYWNSKSKSVQHELPVHYEIALPGTLKKTAK